MATITDTYELTPLQAGMFFHTLSEPHSSAYTEQVLIEVDETLDYEAFLSAWELVVARHDVLRTRFGWEADEPVQEVLDRADVPFELHDLRDLPPARQDERLIHLQRSEHRRGIDLSTAPPVRFAVARLADARWAVVMTWHHCLLDGRSRALVIGEAFAAYDALRAGTDPQLPPARPLREHIEALRGVDLETAERYWTETLAGFRQPTRIAVVHPPDTFEVPDDARFGEFEVALTAAVTTDLLSLADRAGVPISVVIEAAWSLVLHHHSRESDVVFGETRAGRGPRGHSSWDVVGPLINTVPARVKVDLEKELTEWLRTLHEQQLSRRPFEQVALTDIQGWSEVPPQTALFETIVVANRVDPQTEIAALLDRSANRTFRTRDTTHYPITLLMFGGEQITLRMVHARDRVDDLSAERLLGHVATVLEGMSVQPAVVGDIPIVSAEEREQLLGLWSGADATHDIEWSIPELFEEQVARNPSLEAVVGRETVTYGELGLRTTRLAGRLAELGVSTGSFVGVSLERSVELVVAMLGVMKAGGVYVPLDPTLPPERLAFMLDDTAAQVLITREGLAESFTQFTGHMLLVDDPEDVASPTRSLSTPNVGPDDLCYAIYTSGTTGRPKGILLEHRTLSNLLTWHQPTRPGGRVAQLTSIGFDVSLQETLYALVHGQTLHIIDDDTRLSPEKLASHLQQEAITDLFVPNVILEYVAEAAISGGVDLSELRNVYQAGEALTITPAVRAFFERHRGCGLHNHYGPAEAHAVTAETLHGDPSEWPYHPPIGHPIPNVRIYLLDERLELAPIGAPGELCIGGSTLAAGYLNLPELTAERFVPDPFSDVPGATMYRTGDLARHLPDGGLEYMGRLDDQVKIRGFRVEPGEIEARLVEHPGVQQAVVLAREDSPSTKTLVGYLVGQDGIPQPADLREHLAKSLPSHMIPTHFVEVDEVPLNTNGKVDKRALLAIDQGEPSVPDHDPPVGDVERLLASLWEEILDVQGVGRNDNFFDLGGHSLRVARFVSVLRSRWGVDLPIRLVFERPTVALIASLLEFVPAPHRRPPRRLALIAENDPHGTGDRFERILSRQRDFIKTWEGVRRSEDSLVVTFNPEGTKKPLFWVTQGDRQGGFAHLLGQDQPVHFMRSGHLIMEYTDENIAFLVDVYAKEMTALQPEGSFLLGGTCQACWIVNPLAVRLREMGREVELLFLMEPLDFMPQQCPVGLIFGAESFVNPFVAEKDPRALAEAGYEPDWTTIAEPDEVFRKAYPRGYTVHTIPGSHGTFFTKHVEQLASVVSGLLERRHQSTSAPR